MSPRIVMLAESSHNTVMNNTTAPPDHLRRAAAQKYARRGWSVFPIVRGTKDRPLVKWRALEPDRPSVEQVKTWFRQWPTANIGIACGAVSNLTVLDVDVKEGMRGDLTLAALVATHGPLPMTLRQRTRSGGWQILFQYASGTRNSAGTALGPGLDVRSTGGYIVVAPSVVEKDGHIGTYAWETPEAQPVAATPEWLHALMRSGPLTFRDPVPVLLGMDTGGASVERSEGVIATGQRNAMLYRLVRSLRAQQYREAVIEEAVRAVNRQRCQPPFEESEVVTLLRHALTQRDREDW